jgi:DNA-binding protein HU-beta
MPSVVTKSDLVHAAARAGNLSKTAAGEAVNAVFDAIVTSVAKGNRVTVVGFGTFLPRKRKARAGRSPANGKEIKINAKTVPAATCKGCEVRLTALCFFGDCQAAGSLAESTATRDKTPRPVD